MFLSVGSLEEPTVIEDGVKRARKKVQRLSDALDKSLAEKEEKQQPLKVPNGSGIPLGEIEYISHMLKINKPEKLRCLYNIIMGGRGSQAKIRFFLRQFRGFDFEESSPEYERKLKNILMKKASELKEITRVSSF